MRWFVITALATLLATPAAADPPAVAAPAPAAKPGADRLTGTIGQTAFAAEKVKVRTRGQSTFIKGQQGSMMAGRWSVTVQLHEKSASGDFGLVVKFMGKKADGSFDGSAWGPERTKCALVDAAAKVAGAPCALHLVRAGGRLAGTVSAEVSPVGEPGAKMRVDLTFDAPAP